MKRVILFSALLISMVGLTAQITGDVVWEQWNESMSFAEISTATNPDITITLDELSSPSGFGDNYVSRFTGFIVPSVTGEYVFWIRSDDGSEFWLSSDYSTEEKERICYSPGYSSQWTSYPEQKSESVELVAGESYYFEALHKEGSGGDFVEVRWTQPGESEGTRTVIGTANLSQTINNDPSLKNLLAFEFSSLSTEAFYAIDRDNLTIDVDVANGTDLTTLVADFKVSYGATPSFASETAQDYSSPVTLTVTAADASTADYTITVTELPLQTGNEITSFYLDPLGQDAVIDNTENTITYSYFEGYTKDQTITLETSLYASASVNSGTTITVTDPPSTITVTAQDGSQRIYTVVANALEGVKGYADDFSTDADLAGWNNTSAYSFSHDAGNEELNLQMSKVNWADTRFTFPEQLNLYDYPLFRMRLNTDALIYSDGVRIGFEDVYGVGDRHPTNITTKILETGNFVELVLDFTNKYASNDAVEIGEITKLYFDVNRGNTADGKGSDAFIRIDDFRVGSEAVPNQAPSADQPQSPDWSYITGGAQSVIISGIDDGNPGREESISITAKSNNQAVVADGDITVDYDGSDQATVSYTGSSRGFATITVYIKDDRGTVYSDESDTDSITFVAQFRDNTPGVNNSAIFDNPIVPVYFLGTGQNIIILPNVDDGDEGEDQSIVFTVDNLDTDVIRVDSLVYETGDKFALIYFTELGVGAPATLEISCQDQVNIDEGGDEIFTMQVVVQPSVIDNPGVNYGATQTKQWQPVPYKKSLVFRDGYPAVFPEAKILDHCKDNLFWGKMWGYIIPPETGLYQFMPETEGEGVGNFYLSTDHLEENLPESAGDITAANGSPSAAIELQKSKPYYFEAYHKEIINDYKLIVKWSGPNFSQQVVAPPSLVFALDLEKPSAPADFRIAAKGSNEAILAWEASTDNNKIEGYYVLVDGYIYMDSLFTSTSVNIAGLDAETEYQVSVLAVDEFLNTSLPATPLSFTTFGEDAVPPAAPTNATVSEVTIFSATVQWDAAVDNETGIFGYNVYQDGSVEPLNSLPVQDLSYRITGLDAATEYSFEITAVDAGRNESDPSSPATGQTMGFDWENEEEDELIGQVDVTLNPLTKSTGFAVEGGYHLGSILVSNKVSYNEFESEHIKDFALSDDLSKADKVASNVTVYAETDDPYGGEKSLKLTVTEGGYFRNHASITMSPEYTYLVKFAAKKDASYASDEIKVDILKTIGGTVQAHQTTVSGLTTDWQVFEVEFTGIENALNAWWVEWEFLSGGTVYFDNVEMHIKEYYNPDSKFTTIGIDLLKELNPAGIRWGAIGANSQSLASSSGQYQNHTMTYADFAHISNMLGGYALITTGVYDGAYEDGSDILINEDNAVDFVSDMNTFDHLMEYLGGDESTTWGKIRTDEGYDYNMIDALDGLVIELGNEVWGSFSHQAYSFGSDYPYYTEWSNEVAGDHIKASGYYDPEKVYVSISGRSPDQSFGVNENIYESPNEHIDWISLSGYMGGNLNYEAGVDPGESEIDYHINGYQNFARKINGLEENWESMLRETQRVWPVYMYEGNMTTPDYHGTLAQAITFGDYYATTQEHGVAIPSVFAFEGGQWRLIDDMPSLKKRPMFHVTKLFNQAAMGGVVLDTEVKSVDKLKNATGNEIDLPSVGAHAYADGSNYAIVLFSRNMENQYHLAVNLPDDIGTISNGKMYSLTGDNYKSSEVVIDSSDVTITDGMLVTIPKHSMMVLTFQADDKGLSAPMGATAFTEVSSLVLTSEDNSTDLDEKYESLEVYATVSPEDAFFKEMKWELIGNEDNIAVLKPLGATAKIQAEGSGNGTVTVRATTLDGTGLSDELTFTISNQTIGIENTLAGMGVKVYPNPASNHLFVELPEGAGKLQVLSLQGALLLEQQVFSEKHQLDVSDLKQGIYMIRVETEKGAGTKRFFKQ